MQQWNKIGRIFQPAGDRAWMRTHASNPVAIPLDENLHRVYFSGRDVENRAHIAFVDIDLRRPHQVQGISSEPLFGLGELGAFDDRGASVGCRCMVGDREHIYYLGWNLAHDVPFRNSIGLAIRNGDGTDFRRYSDGPIVDRDTTDPFSVSYPFVIHDEGIYKMWYGSHKRWGRTTSDMIHALKYADSEDGIHWRRTGKICIDTTERDYAFSKPFVLKEHGIYKMWYSFRGGSYRIGYAESSDGLDWTKKHEEVGLDVSEEGWDSEMVCYPFVIDHRGARYLLYNGNRYGETGFGLAVLEQE